MTTCHDDDDAAIATDKLGSAVKALTNALPTLGASVHQGAPEAAQAAEALASATEAAPLSDSLGNPSRAEPAALSDHLALSVGSISLVDTRLTIASLPANQQKIAEAALAVRQGESLDVVLDILSDIQVDPLAAATINLYRVGNRLMGEFDLEEAYPRMDRQVRNVLFYPVAPLFAGSGGARDSKVALYDTPLSTSVLDAAYGPGNDHLAVACRPEETVVPAVAAVSAADPIAPTAAKPRIDIGQVRYDVDFDRVDPFCHNSGGGLVVLSAAGCYYCCQVIGRLHEVAARLDVPVILVDRAKIPPPCRPIGYPHIYAISRDNLVCVYDGDRSTDDLVRFVCAAIGSDAVRD
ncbi:hypothetical protein pqer_cds_437 [Pandoravirus quercus]|uniref:Uncharacterized protein n=1 Tax=Pandoravirus quercus TaxID=2107709 RepID=A0A2U7U8V3_9VIRU|nr:hypothetical protein pqer_cds_437 [Pandoravirus quercus]AVK74859.1 hypothetical protein pqer_cds_437 [Pandoravirus quercus]